MYMAVKCGIQNRKNILSIASIEKPSNTCPYIFFKFNIYKF